MKLVKKGDKLLGVKPVRKNSALVLNYNSHVSRDDIDKWRGRHRRRRLACRAV